MLLQNTENRASIERAKEGDANTQDAGAEVEGYIYPESSCKTEYVINGDIGGRADDASNAWGKKLFNCKCLRP